MKARLDQIINSHPDGMVTMSQADLHIIKSEQDARIAELTAESERWRIEHDKIHLRLSQTVESYAKEHTECINLAAKVGRYRAALETIVYLAHVDESQQVARNALKEGV